jgi:2-polyprenyl-3-methyl-5-hydroxy-6-metoxy-1,4-benzoquinol methylase
MPVVRIAEAQLHPCDSCGSWTYFPRPTPSEQSQLHDTEEYFNHPYFRARREDNLAHQKRCQEVFARLEKLAGWPPISGQRLLDIGCDTGSFLSAAAELYGVVPFGVDVSRRAVDVARGRGFNAHWGRIEEAPPEFAGFNVVTAIDVIEHVVDPEAFLRSLQARMEPAESSTCKRPILPRWSISAGAGSVS